MAHLSHRRRPNSSTATATGLSGGCTTDPASLGQRPSDPSSLGWRPSDPASRPSPGRDDLLLLLVDPSLVKSKERPHPYRCHQPDGDVVFLLRGRGRRGLRGAPVLDRHVHVGGRVRLLHALPLPRLGDAPPRRLPALRRVGRALPPRLRARLRDGRGVRRRGRRQGHHHRPQEGHPPRAQPPRLRPLGVCCCFTKSKQICPSNPGYDD